MNGTQTPGLQLPRCCAHLVSWDDQPRTDHAVTDGDTRDRDAEARRSGGEFGGQGGLSAEQRAVP
ncbi:hypothetical protein [Streptomyces sp. NPDC001492]